MARVTLSEQVPVPGEKLMVEVQQARGVVWQQAVVKRAKGKGRFTVCVNGESDFIEEYGLEDQGREWKRPRATIDRLEKERAARGPAAEKAASQVAPPYPYP